MRWFGTVASALLLIVVWCVLWGDFSWANLASGVVVSVVALVSAGGGRRPSTDPVAFSRFVGLAVADLVVSTYAVAWEVLTPTDYTDEAVVGMPLAEPLGARARFAVVIAVTLTPGTAVVEVEDDEIVLHVLHADRWDQTRRHVDRLVELAAKAFPTTRHLEVST